MDSLQTWIVVGVPGVLLAAVLLVGRSALRALGGLAVLVATMLTFVLVAGDAISATVIGVVVVVFVANGRGLTDSGFAEHHETRGRFTTAAGE